MINTWESLAIMINIVIPMAGAGSRFLNEGYDKPKPFVDVAGKTMIERVMDNLSNSNYNARFILIARKEHLLREKKIVKTIQEKYNVILVSIDNLTEGTACTVLFAREYINNNSPLLIANSDQLVDVNINSLIDDCISRDLDGSILTFIDEFSDPKWSFARVNKDFLVQEVQEKKVISDYATVGIYLYTKGSDFVNAAIDMIINNDRVNNEFYTCPTYNYLIQNGKKIGISNIDPDQMHGLGTPVDLNKYLECYFDRMK
jgi:UDP-N-acetylglucosamine diphosphorylase / glucose-1-phosphate thymidylyltransferase / UDP-N-acetylgalactosamine diphosphorylase / glucosamine-1-phosphate N-acetyltransferase / galactosamine-1-phosphate N-acetyltransferase